MFITSKNSPQDLIQSYLASEGKCAQDLTHVTAKLLQCSACKLTTYCSIECQKKDWGKHKIICKHLLKPVEISYIPPINYTELVKKIIPRKKNLYFEDERVDISSDELFIQKSLNKLRKMGPVGNLAIGIGGFCTLDLASVRENIDYILIVDVSARTQLFWKKMLPIIRNAEDRKDCEKKIHQNIISWIENYGHCDKNTEYYISLLIKGTSWLSREDRFSRIKEIFSNNRFAFIRMDITDNKAVRALQAIHDSNGLIADIMYLSNIINFIQAEDLEKFGCALSILTTSKTIFIDTEEEPYKITSNLSERFSCLSDCICFASNYEIKSLPQLKLQTKQRGEDIQKFYPIIKLSCKIDSDKLFYAFGIYRDYYEQEEMDKIDAIVEKITSKSATEDDIALLTLKILYPLTTAKDHKDKGQ